MSVVSIEVVGTISRGDNGEYVVIATSELINSSTLTGSGGSPKHNGCGLEISARSNKVTILHNAIMKLDERTKIRLGDLAHAIAIIDRFFQSVKVRSRPLPLRGITCKQRVRAFTQY